MFATIVGKASSNVLLVGGPGTGKTVVVGALVKHFLGAGYSVRYVAPLRQITNSFSARAGDGVAYTTQRFCCNNRPDFAIFAWQRQQTTLYNSGRIGAVLIVDEVFATRWEDLRDIETVCNSVYGRAVRFIFVGDPYQLRNPEGGPAANSRLLRPSVLSIIKMPEQSHRSTHPWLVQVTASLRGMNVAVAADRLLTEANYWGNRRPHAVDMWLVATHAEVDTRNLQWQRQGSGAAFVCDTVNGKEAPHKFPCRLLAGGRAMFTEAWVVKEADGNAKTEWANRTQVVVKTWGRNPEADTPPAFLHCCAGDMEVKVLVEPILPCGALSGVDVWVHAVAAADVTNCRWLPLQGMGAVTANVTQGMTMPDNMRLGIDGTNAHDPRAWWTVALTRSVVPEGADIRDYFPVINYPPGAVLREAGRTKTELALRTLCTGE